MAAVENFLGNQFLTKANILDNKNNQSVAMKSSWKKDSLSANQAQDIGAFRIEIKTQI